MFDGRLALIQRVLPAYRVPFFDALAASCAGGMSLLAGLPLAAESIATANALRTAHFAQTTNLHFLNHLKIFYLRLYFRPEIIVIIYFFRIKVLRQQRPARRYNLPRRIRLDSKQISALFMPV